MNDHSYAGFWVRVLAALIDTALIIITTSPILIVIYGSEYWMNTSILVGFWDFVVNYILPAIAVIVFWVYKSATPGKMILKLKIVDANTGGHLSATQCIGRYFAYYLSTIPFLLGLIWVGIDRRKQGWHDKLAGTIVIRNS